MEKKKVHLLTGRCLWDLSLTTISQMQTQMEALRISKLPVRKTLTMMREPATVTIILHEQRKGLEIDFLFYNF